MDAGQKTDRPPEQIVREVGLTFEHLIICRTLCLRTYKVVQAHCDTASCTPRR